MQKTWIRVAFILGLLLTSFSFSFAQDEEEELPEIPYIRAKSGYNVPILELEGWDNQSTPDDALFVNDELSSKILVTMVRTLNDSEAIQTASAKVFDGTLPEPRLESRIGVSNGTWTQQLFSIDNVSISALALVRGDRTFVIVLYEASTDYDVYQLAIRSPQLPRVTEDAEPETDFFGGIDAAMQAFTGEELSAQSLEEIVDLGLPAAQTVYSTDAAEFSVFALEFDGITYATIGTGDIETSTRIGEAINTTFLGFFITPDNSNYLYLGLGAVAVIFGILIGSMWIRYANVKKDMALVEELASKE